MIHKQFGITSFLKKKKKNFRRFSCMGPVFLGGLGQVRTSHCGQFSDISSHPISMPLSHISLSFLIHSPTQPAPVDP